MPLSPFAAASLSHSKRITVNLQLLLPSRHVSIGAHGMQTRSRIIALIAILTLGALPLFAGTRIVFRWVLTGIPMPNVKKILIVGLTDNYLVRQEFEDKMEELLAKSNVTGIKSHMVFPPRNELMEEELRQRIRESTLDAVLVVQNESR
jgi:hypothetical protein